MANEMVAMLLIGMGIGLYVPTFPAPIDVINPYFGLVLLFLGIIVMLKK